MIETRIEERGERITTYATLKAETNIKLFEEIYVYFNSYKYCWEVDRFMENKELEKEYLEWKSKNFHSLWYKHASGMDFD